MSLFKAREWWATKAAGDAEEFGRGSMCVANIDNEAPERLKIVTGSFAGMVRIFCPHQQNFKPEDQLLEVNVGKPILQLEAGFFISGQPRVLGLAVLHPRELAVYLVTAVKGDSRETSYYSLGPLCYVQQIDSFVTCNSMLEVASFKYQTLVSSHDTQPTTADNNIVAGKRVQVDWACNVGEQVLEICTARCTKPASSAQLDIVCLGQRSVFMLSEGGAVRHHRRLDYDPSCAVPYVAAPAGDAHADGGAAPSHNLLVCSFTRNLMVYKEKALLWNACLSCVPVAMRVVTCCNIRGLICLLDDNGRLQIIYLGTAPPANKVAAVESYENSYADVEQDYAVVRDHIKRSTHASSTSEVPSDQLQMSCKTPTRMAAASTAYSRSDEPPSFVVEFCLAYQGPGRLQDVEVTLAVPACFTVKDNHFTVRSLDGATTVPVHVQLNRAAKQVPADMLIHATAVCASPVRTAKCTCCLPLSSVGRVVARVDNANYKLTMDTDKGATSLAVLFPDLFDNDSAARGEDFKNVFSFQLYTVPADVTILVSNTGRYRIQSNQFEALWLIAVFLVNSLRAHFGDGIAIGMQQPIPLADYLRFVQEHFKCRQQVAALNRRLEQRAHQFRVVQKSLLLRFKDKNPASIANLDKLFNATFSDTMQLSSEIEAMHGERAVAANNLACATQLLLLLLCVKHQLDEANAAALRAYLPPVVTDDDEQGWEETVEANVNYLLRCVMTRTPKEPQEAGLSLAPVTDVTRLEKGIALVCDRLSKGAKVVAPPKRNRRQLEGQQE